MKVLHINAVYGVGSTGVIVEDIHKLSMENGIESYVAYSTTRKNPSEIQNGYVIGKNLGKKAHALLCRINGKQAYFSRGATKGLIRHIDEIKPDIVHLHNLHSNYIHMNMLLSYLGKNNISTVITLHDCWFYTGGCFHYTNAKCDGWLKECGNCPKKREDTPAYLFDKSAQILSDRKKYFGAINDLTVVGVSEWITNEGTRTFLKGRRAMLIHNGIDFDVFKPTSSDIRSIYNIEEKFVLLGTAERWLFIDNKKDFEYFVENLPADCAFVLFGCTDEQIKHLSPNVIGLKYECNKARVCQIYSMADVFVNCSKEESLSLVNIEAQACGTPTVTYKNTGAKETVDNINSFSVETEKYEALFQMVMEIKSNGKSSYSEGCREFVINKFDREENYKKYIELYKKIFYDKNNSTKEGIVNE